MRDLSDSLLAAIGRMTVAATDLEHLLAWIGADRAGGDAAAVFRQPGEPLRAARGSVEFAAPAFRDAFIGEVDAAGALLARGQATLRALWQDDAQPDPAVFDGAAALMLRCRDELRSLVDAQLVASRTDG